MLDWGVSDGIMVSRVATTLDRSWANSGYCWGKASAGGAQVWIGEPGRRTPPPYLQSLVLLMSCHVGVRAGCRSPWWWGCC